jgi:hypothetical protein
VAPRELHGQFAYTLGVRKCTHRFGSSFAFEGFAHGLSTAEYVKLRQCRFSISNKRNLLIRTFSRGGSFVELMEAFYRRQDFFESGAVNVPDS